MAMSEGGLYAIDVPKISDIASTVASTVVQDTIYLPFECALVGMQVSVSSPTGVSGRVGLFDTTSSAAALDTFATIATSTTQYEQPVNSTFENVYRVAGARYTIRAAVPTGNRLQGVRVRVLFRPAHRSGFPYLKDGT